MLIFGGHGDDPSDLQWFRRYFNSDRVGVDGMGSIRAHYVCWQGRLVKAAGGGGFCHNGAAYAARQTGSHACHPTPLRAPSHHPTHGPPHPPLFLPPDLPPPLQSVTKQKMSSARWYPTPVTLPDGRILVVGGVPDPGDAGYDGITRALDAEPALDNPT